MLQVHQEGGCSCGRTRYKLTDSALIVHACHCRMCQRLTGSNNAINILIEAANIALSSGETVEILAHTPSGEGQVITRCKFCFDALWSEYRRFTKWHRASVRFVRAGTLDAPEAFPPDVHIFTESKQPHVCLGDGKPRFKAFYNHQKVWRESSLARLAAASASEGKTQLHGRHGFDTPPLIRKALQK